MNGADAIACGLLAIADLAMIVRFRRLSVRRIRMRRMKRCLRLAVAGM